MATRSEKEELFKTIWSIADDLRGAVDGWNFKAYVLGAIFYRYISENITNNIEIVLVSNFTEIYDALFK